VEVIGRPVAGLLLRGRLQDPPDSAWYVLGAPRPTPVLRDGEYVLSLNGDGSHHDGIMSRRAFALPRGAMLELEFRMAVTRRDRQRVIVCLEQTSPPASGELAELGNWLRHQTACVGYPHGELVKFRPGEVVFGANGAAAGVALPGELPPTDWTHLGLQVRPDGEVSLFVNHRRVAVAALRLDLGRDAVWRVNIGGSAVDTEALVRNVLLWDGPHFLAELDRSGH
jgi:hypothetical protein